MTGAYGAFPLGAFALGTAPSRRTVCPVRAERRAASRMRTTVTLLTSDDRSVGATVSVPRTTAAS